MDDYCEALAGDVLDRRQEGVERRGKHIAELNQRAAEADMRLKHLYDAIEARSIHPNRRSANVSPA